MKSLEEEVTKLDKHREELARRYKAEKDEADRLKAEDEKKQFRKDFEKYFGWLREYVTVSWFKYGSRKAHFVYRGEDYYIGELFWESPSVGVDDWYTSGYRWTLFQSHNGHSINQEFPLHPEDHTEEENKREIFAGLSELGRKIRS